MDRQAQPPTHCGAIVHSSVEQFEDFGLARRQRWAALSGEHIGDDWIHEALRVTFRKESQSFGAIDRLLERPSAQLGFDDAITRLYSGPCHVEFARDLAGRHAAGDARENAPLSPREKVSHSLFALVV